MSNVERFGTFYAPWPVIDGKPLNLQWGEIRSDMAETKAITRNSFQELQDGQDELNAIRALLGQAYGDISFNKRYRFYYNKSTLEFCLQKNINTPEDPTWEDVWCIRLSDGQFQVVSPGGIQSSAGFYGPGLEMIYEIGETGGSVASQEAFLHVGKLFFNQDDGFELNRINSGGNLGGIEVRYTFPVGRAEEFIKSGREWVVDHNFGVSPVMVQVMDGDKRVVIPDTADVSDPNTAYFYFHASVSGSVYIATGGIGAVSLVPKDPFYLVVRHTHQPAAEHLFHSNADMIFDNRFFYVDVNLDTANGGAHKTANISLIPAPVGISSITNVTGDRNISVNVSGGVAALGLQPKLGGMKGFYFNNGDNIYPGSSMHFEVGGRDRAIIGKDGTKFSDKVKSPAFYIDGPSGASLNISPSSTSTVIVEATGNLIIKTADTTKIVQMQSQSGNFIRAVSDGIGLSAANAGGIVGIAAADHVAFTEADGLTLRAKIGTDGLSVRNKVRAEAFYLSGGGNIYSQSDNKIHFETIDASFDTMVLSNYQVLISDNSPAIPALASIYDPDTGLYWSDDDVLNFSAGGQFTMSVGRDGVSIKDKMEANAFYMGGGAANIYQLGDGRTKFENAIGLDIQVLDGGVQFSVGRDGVKTTKIKSAGFYLTEGANNGFDLGTASISIDIPTPSIDNYFLDSWVPQGYVVEEIVLGTTSGSAIVGFYTMSSAEVSPRGIGIVGKGKDGNMLGEFYLMPFRRSITATSGNYVNADGSLVMSVLETSSAKHIRGRVRIRLSG